ncbi:hypothetical protein VPH35_068711 [Triticum aestivum]
MEEAQCGRCNSRCRTSLSTATLSGIYFQPSFVVAAIIPCNVRLAFNELVADTVTFDALGGPYTMQVEKGRKITQIGGDDWDHFIARMRLTGGELISFSFRRDRPRISVIYLNSIPDSEHEVHEDEDGADLDDDENPLVEYLYAQGLSLGDEEIGNLWDMLPLREDYLGKPFVTRLTRTNVKRHIMKLPKRLLDSCGIDPGEEGMAAGLRLTRTGSITSCAYAVDTDGRTVLSWAGWKKFLRAKNLRVGQAILLTVANTRRHDLRMMITIHLI